MRYLFCVIVLLLSSCGTTNPHIELDGFKDGDMVRLKSGGPAMTIKTIHYGSTATCVWFDNGERKEGVFDRLSLDHYKNDK